MTTWENVLKNEEDSIEKGMLGNLFRKVKGSFQNFRAGNKLRPALEDFERALRAATKGTKFMISFMANVEGMPRYMGNEKTLYLAGFTPMGGNKLITEFENTLGRASSLEVRRMTGRVKVPGEPAPIDELEVTVVDRVFHNVDPSVSGNFNF
jgi:hypothetical protein